MDFKQNIEDKPIKLFAKRRSYFKKVSEKEYVLPATMGFVKLSSAPNGG
jgi:hypothetical protein